MTVEHPRHVVVAACLVRDGAGRVLLIRHHRRGWEMPQGRVEEGEGLLEALQREVHEETGVVISPGPLAAVWSRTSPPAALIMGFLGSYREGELQPSDETPEVAWFLPAQALEQVGHPVMRERLATLMAYDGTTAFITA